METFSVLDYAKIELANQWGMDKLLWNERIEWASNPDINWKKAESPIQYYNALENYYKVLNGEKSNATVSLDACASALQHISLIAECFKTAEICNVIGSKRNDAYSIIHQATGLPNIPRKLCKDAIMQSSYGGKRTANDIYGSDIEKFYSAMNQEAPAALQYVDLTQSLWNAKALEHSWVMPDNFHVEIPVETSVQRTIRFKGKSRIINQILNIPTKYGKSISANIIHSQLV